MTEQQKTAIKCAMADLVFASIELCHETAGQSIIDLYKAFPDILAYYKKDAEFEIAYKQENETV